MAGDKKRMAITVDFYDREIVEGIESLALLSRKTKSAYIREVLTKHYEKERAFLYKVGGINKG